MENLMASVPHQHISFEEFLRQEAVSPTKHEYYRGEVFAMAGGSVAHNRIASNIHWRLAQALEGKPCLPNNSDVMIQADGLNTYPDASVVCPPIERVPGAIEVVANPKVIIEVLSPTTESYDRNVKFNHYERTPSVEEILLVLQEAPLVEHFALRKGTSTRTAIAGLDASVTLASIDCRLLMSQIYENVEFPPNPFPRLATT
jgi:Uma2 family endonuclease